MEDDTDVPPERDTKDFLFRQLKQNRLFPSPQELPKERSNLLAVSNKYGFLFAGGPPGLKIFRIDDVLVPVKAGQDHNDIELAPPGIEVPTQHPVHHVALSSDNLTLSVCTGSSDRGSYVFFYDVRTLVGESRQPKEAFTCQLLSREPGSFVTDLKWNPVMPNMVAVSLSDGSISVFQVTETVNLFANLPATLGVTCVCWSPKGKQLAVGKQNGTVVQYVPNLEERKVIPCPSFYESDPVKVLDILWVSTYVFAVVYAAADGSLETSPQLVMVLLPKKEDKRGERFLNFTETCYSSCSERQHHFFMNYIDDWDILLGASAASIEVSVIARPPDQSLWELWLLEDSSRAELPVSDNNDDTLPMGAVVSYTSQLSVFVNEEKILPPTPILLLLSTDGVLSSFHMINLNPGVKPLTVKAERLPMEGERAIRPAALGSSTPGPSAAVASPPLSGALIGSATNTPPSGLPGKSTAPALRHPTMPHASTPTFVLSVPTGSEKTQTAPPVLSLPATSGTAKPQTSAPPTFDPSITTGSAKPPTSAPPAFILTATTGSTKPQTSTPALGLPATTGTAKPQTAAASSFNLFAASSSAKPPPTASTFSFSSTNLPGKPQPGAAFGLLMASAPAAPQAASFGFSMPSSNFSFNPQDNSSFAGKPQASPFSAPSTSLPVVTVSSSSIFGAPTTSYAKQSGAPVVTFGPDAIGGTFDAAAPKPETTSGSNQAADTSIQLAPSSVRVNLKDKFGAVDVPQPKTVFAPSTPGISFTPPAKTAAPGSIAVPTSSLSSGTPSRPFSDVSLPPQSALPPQAAAQKAARVLPVVVKQTPPPQPVGSFHKVADNKDPIYNGIKEEIAHFQKELDDLKARTAKTCFTVGTEEEMRHLTTESDQLHSFLLEIQDTTKIHHADIGCLKTTVLEGLSNSQNARKQEVRISNPVYRLLLYKKALDPMSEAQIQEIRRLHQYVRSEVQGVSDVLDLEWDRFVESNKKQKGYPVSDRETLFNTLANNQEIIKQQKTRLNQLVETLTKLRLYNCTSQWTNEEFSSPSNDVEVESLRDRLSKTTIDATIKQAPKLPPKLSPVKQNQLRNFLTKRKTPPVRSLAPVGLSRSSFLIPNYIEDLDDVSSSSSLSEAAECQGRLSEVPIRQETPPPEPSPVRSVRHAPVTRTMSMQPSFGTPAAPFGKVQPGHGPITSTPAVSMPAMRVIPPGADSTMLATKTVKHGAPTVSASQAAAAAALRRQQITNLPPAALTESTLQTVPKVVNVKELKGSGPGPNIQLVMMATTLQTAGQSNNQAMNKVAAAQAKQVPPAGGLKPTSISAPSGTPQPAPVLVPSKGTGPAVSSPSGPAVGASASKAFPFSTVGVFTPGPSPASAASSSFGSLGPGKDSQQPASFMSGPVNKVPFASGSETSSPFVSFLPPPSSSSSADPGGTGKPTAAQTHAAAPAAPLLTKDPAQPANFMSGGGMKPQFSSPPDTLVSFVSVMQPASEPADSSTNAKTAAPQVLGSMSAPLVMAPVVFSGGETLGSFSGLRVGQAEEASKAAPSVAQTKAQSVGSLLSSSKPEDPASVPSTSLPLVFNPSAVAGIFMPAAKSGFSFTPAAAPPAGGVSSVVQASAGFGFLPPVTSAASIPVTTATVTPGLFGSDDKQQMVSEKSVPDSAASTQLQALLAQPSEGRRQPAAGPVVGSTVSVPTAAISTDASTGAESKTLTAPISTFTANINLGQNATTTSAPALVSPVAPPAITILSSQTPDLVAAATSGPHGSQVTTSGGSTTPGSAFVQPPAALSSAALSSAASASLFGQTQAASSGSVLFGQQSSGSTSTSGSADTTFGSSVFRATEGSGGFGQATFGQTGSFWKASPGSADNFSFKPQSFASQPIFGQPPASTAAASNSGGGLFGNTTNTSNASTFSFGPPSSSSSGAPTTVGGLFVQSATQAFGQNASTFGQGTPAFGSASSSTTTTTSSSVFGFGAGFPPSSSGSVFGQSQNTGSSVFGQSATSSGGLFGASSGGSGSGGFFSGLGGKPSQEAANKNPFGSSTAAFGSSGSSNTSSLFGNSGAKAFGFGGTPTFGDQKSSGTFSGGGSVASQGFGFTSPSKTGGFGAAPVFGSPPTFGGSPGFGGAPTFGTAPGFTSPLGSTSGKVFGEGTAAASTGGFGFGSSGGGTTTFGSLANQSAPSFGVLSQQSSGFGAQGSGFAFGPGNSGAAPGSGGGFSFGATNQSSSAFGGGWRS
ncbi:nuclear pore complex protein Nup214 isoform X2 [Ranitomeya variabilis]|uniref:nuclear pore complex protein Nup214 isoform X2 n=1 Tax=Ranitomeya variabilis TaxID=490064 RepID=UPI00405709FE